jgi:poly(A) polymerase
MNALYADARWQVIDPLGGLPDLLARRVRFVGDPETRIREDYLRILRFFRFHACYGDPASRGWTPRGWPPVPRWPKESGPMCRANGSGRDAQTSDPRATPPRPLRRWRSRACWRSILPGADTARACARWCIWSWTCQPRWLRRLAAWGAKTWPTGLRLSRQDETDLTRIRDHIGSSPMRPQPWVGGWLLGGSDLAVAPCYAAAPFWKAPCPRIGMVEDTNRGAAATFPVTAADLMPTLQGPALGARLKALQNRWLRSDLRLDKAALLQGSDE